MIMLTARAEESERIVGLELGADDYIAKPFSPNELVARVRALLRRSRGSRTARTGDIRPHCRRRRAAHGGVDGKDVDADRQGVSAAGLSAAHRGRVLSRDMLLTDVWGYSYTGGTRTVDVHVRRLREKLPPLGDALVTVKQFGYKLLDLPPRSNKDRSNRPWRCAQLPAQAVLRRAVVRGDCAGGRRRDLHRVDATQTEERSSRRWWRRRASPPTS